MSELIYELDLIYQTMEVYDDKFCYDGKTVLYKDVEKVKYYDNTSECGEEGIRFFLPTKVKRFQYDPSDDMNFFCFTTMDLYRSDLDEENIEEIVDYMQERIKLLHKA